MGKSNGFFKELQRRIRTLGFYWENRSLAQCHQTFDEFQLRRTIWRFLVPFTPLGGSWPMCRNGDMWKTNPGYLSLV